MSNTSLPDENVSEFSTVRSKTSREISISLYFENVRSERYRPRVENYRRLKLLPGHEAEAQAVKDSMPCIVPAGVCQGGHAVKNLTRHSGLLCIDLDHTDHRTQEIFLLTQSLPYVRGSHISISNEGVKIFVRVRTADVERNYAGLYAAVGRAIATHVAHPYDDKCKILTQPCFYSWHPEAYTNKEAETFQWKEETEKGTKGSGEAEGKENRNPSLPKEEKKGTPGKGIAASETTVTSEASTAPEAVTTASAPGFLVQFLDDFERRNPFRRGSRNDLALKLGRVARSKGFSREELKEVIGIFARRYANGDFTTENIRERVTAGYQFVEEKKKQEMAADKGQNGVRFTLTPPTAPNEEETAEEVLEKNDALRATAPYIDDKVYDHLPDFLKRCCIHASDKRERDLLLLGSLNSCSALFPYVSFYYKKLLYSPHFYLAVPAAAGTGKGVMALSSVLLDPTQELYDQQRRTQKKAYEQALLEWDQEQQQARREKRMPDIEHKPEEPRPQYLKISATTSKSRLIQSLAAAGEIGCCMTSTEINTMVSSLGQDYGNYEDILCKAAHHEEVSSSYKVDGDPIVVPRPHLALNIAGTQEQFHNFFRSLEVGLYSRFAIYTRQQNLRWESCAPVEGQTDQYHYFRELGKELRQMHEGLLLSPTLITFSPAQWKYHTDLFSQLLNRALAEGSGSASSIILRSGLLGMRLAAILTVFRKWEDYRYAKEYGCTDEDFETAMSLVQTLIEHSLLLSTSLPETSRPPVSLRRFHRTEDVLNALPKCFTYTELIQAVLNAGASESTGKRILKKAIDTQLIKKEGDSYKKKNHKRPKQGSR